MFHCWLSASACWLRVRAVGASFLLLALLGMSGCNLTTTVPSNGSATVVIRPGDPLPSDPNAIIVVVIPLYEPSLLLGLT